MSISYSALYLVEVVLILPTALLLVTFLASAVPFAIDQIITGSSDNILCLHSVVCVGIHFWFFSE